MGGGGGPLAIICWLPIANIAPDRWNILSIISSISSLETRLWRAFFASCLAAEEDPLLFRASRLGIISSKCSLALFTNFWCMICCLCSSRIGKLLTIVSAYSERATLGLDSHSQVNGWSYLKILPGSRVSLAGPYGVIKLLGNC